MPRVVGVDIPGDKKLTYALCYIRGIGLTTAVKALAELGIDGDKRAREVTPEEIARLAAYLDQNVVIEGALRRQVQMNIQRLNGITCYRGLRHRRNLPVRGQRTRTNARTRKGKKKTVAVKRSIKAM